MARTIGSAVFRRKRFGSVIVELTTDTGTVRWYPRNGATLLTKQQRQEACDWVFSEADGWDLFPPHTTREQNMAVVWNKLFGGQS